MKLEWLAGYGPLAAIVSGVALVVCLLVLMFGPVIAPALNAISLTLIAIAAIAAGTWPAALVVVGLDLNWLEHPATHTGRMRLSLYAVALAAVTFPIFGVLVAIFSTSNSTLPELGLVVLGACIAYFLIVQNWEARRAGLLHGVLPWLGLVAGGCFALMAIASLAGQVSSIFFGLAFLSFFAGAITFVFWAIWLGIRLRGATPLAATPDALA